MQTASRLMAMVAGVLLALASSATARTIYVPSDEPTVQRAVDAALPDDTISVAPGTYFEHIRIRSEDKNGITIEAADPANPPMLQGNTNVSSDGILIEHAHGVTLRTLSVRDAYNGVRVNNAMNTRVVDLRLENNALGVRIYRGRNNSVIDSTILGTRVEEGILVDSSPGATLAGNVIERASREGIRVLQSPCAILDHNLVMRNRGGDGIAIYSSAGTDVTRCMAFGNYRDGFHLVDSPDLVLTSNAAANNTSFGLRVLKCRPFDVPSELTAGGNWAAGNRGGNIVVHPDLARTPSVSCGSASPAGSGAGPRPTLTPSSTLPRTTVPPTTLPQPRTLAHWRFYVQTTINGTMINFDVPRRSIEAPLAVSIAAEHVTAFSPGVQMSGTEIQALGRDTLARLSAAADAYVRAHPGDYESAPGIVHVHWAKRDVP